MADLYTNPVIDSNNPDPAVLSLPDGGYLAVATSNHATDSATQDAFPIYFSLDLVHWELQGWRRILSLFSVCNSRFAAHVFPAGSWPAWADRNM